MRAAFVIRFWAAALLLVLTSASTQRALCQSRPADRVIGLVEIPVLFGERPVSGTQSAIRLTLRAAPTTSAQVALQTLDPTTIEQRKVSGETNAAAVYGIVDGWFLVRYRAFGGDRTAWLAPNDAGPFRSVGELLKGKMAYLSEDWDRQVYTLPSRASRTTPVRGSRVEMDVAVADYTRDDSGQDWVLVVAFAENRCGSERYPAIVASGWVPVYSAGDKLQAWFHAGGC